MDVVVNVLAKGFDWVFNEAINALLLMLLRFLINGSLELRWLG